MLNRCVKFFFFVKLSITKGGSNTNTNPRERNNSSNTSNNSGGGSGGGGSSFLAEFLKERFNSEAGFLDMDDLPPSTHNITVVLSRLLTEAKKLFGESVSYIYISIHSGF